MITIITFGMGAKSRIRILLAFDIINDCEIENPFFRFQDTNFCDIGFIASLDKHVNIYI